MNRITPLRILGTTFVMAACAVTLTQAEDDNESLLDAEALPDPIVWISVEEEGTPEAKKAESGIKVVNINGDTTIFYEGEKVWQGKTEGKVSAKATDVDGKKYAVAMEGDRVIWEKGERPEEEKVAEVEKMKPDERLLVGDIDALMKGKMRDMLGGDIGGLGLDIDGLMEEGVFPEFGEGIGGMNSLKTVSINGDTVIYYQGEKVWEGKTTGKISGKATVINGKKYAEVKEDDRIIWATGDGVGGTAEPGADF